MSGFFTEGVFLPTRARRRTRAEVAEMEAEMELILVDRELDALADRWGLVELEVKP